jgi:hypothetical protein
MFLICLVMPWPATGQQPEIATTVAFIEGPAVEPEGNVDFTDIINRVSDLQERSDGCGRGRA